MVEAKLLWYFKPITDIESFRLLHVKTKYNHV